MKKNKVWVTRKDNIRQRYNKGYGMGVFITRKRFGGKHLGDETNPEVAKRMGAAAVPADYHDYPEMQEVYARDRIREDDIGDIQEVVVTDKDDYATFHWKKGQGVLHPSKDEIYTEDEVKKADPDKRKGIDRVRNG